MQIGKKPKVYLRNYATWKLNRYNVAEARKRMELLPGSIPGGVSGFFSDLFLPTVPWPWGRLSP